MSPRGESPYPNVPASPKFPKIEEGVLAGWEADHTFEKSVDQRRGAPEYVFYDGPPFANGLPHYGHLLTGFVKDVVPRYRTMRGQLVERRFGWDCHGLPAETEAEKQLGVSGRGPIEKYGIARFNSFCQASVLRYTSEWERYVTRQARWVDFQNDYKTMDLPYMESVMWALKQLHDKGLMYEDYRVLPYCWECETPLSNSETRQDDAYRDRQDPAVTVAFELEDGLRLWVWTTTPWTLPSNLALAVGPDIEYAVYERDGERFALGAGLVAKYERELEGARPTGTIFGRDLVGRRYRPLFPYFADAGNAFVVLAGAFVSTEEGTGVVHMAPGFGEDDQIACAAAGIAIVCPVDSRTRFTSEVPDFEGLQVFEANQPVIRALRAAGSLVRQDSYVHSYPHCWRTDTPLVYRAVSSWFVKVTAIKDRLLECNQEIHWAPEHVRDGSFGKWLENARDWSISRNRFWGSPIPVWKSDDPDHPRIDVYGSLDELERDFGVRPADLHRPSIDQLTRPNPDDPTGRSTMRRVSDVLDCWFESGSMPFAQVHYPFENQEWFDSHFPGDFIVEYIGQTRGWFYTLHVLAVALFDRPAFSNCLAHGILLGDDSQKMSKRLKNYPDPDVMFEKHGADAMRWFLMSSPIMRGGDMIVDEKGIREAVRSALLPLWNAWYFFTLYANADGRQAVVGRTPDANVLDRYILASLSSVVTAVTTAMDDYDLSGACAAIEGFLDKLTNWYIRRSRDRFWGTAAGQEGDTQDAFDTLATVLDGLCRLAAPLLPILTESVWTGLTGAPSVHLAGWPAPSEFPADDALVETMDLVREVCSAAHSVRKANNLRARLPLSTLVVASPSAAALQDFAPLIADEVNVQAVVPSPDPSAYASARLEVVFKVAAPRLGQDVQSAARAAKAGDWSLLDGPDGPGTRARVGTVELEPGEFLMKVTANDERTTRPLPGNAGVVVLDIEVTPELAVEGRARDLVREIQQLRRSEDLAVTDRIAIELSDGPPIEEVLAAHSDWIAEQVLAVSLTATDGPLEGPSVTLADGIVVTIRIRRA
ncbi:MAG TPA: isoleucine--tRNA ligase [Acidimicrobiales bacterium]|jgi:isoleucyl-tRNA synthetase|nr:isoleucine--tRNA ligase [Acidimicrobiales bacterium]